MTDAEGKLTCVYVKEIAGSKSTVTVFCPSPAFEGQLPSTKLSQAKETVPGTEDVPKDGWFVAARCDANASPDGRWVHIRVRGREEADVHAV